MGTTPKDGVEAQEQAARVIYDRNAATPLPPPTETGEFHSYSPADAVLQQRDGELFAQTGMDPGARRQMRETFRSIQKTTGLPDTVVAQIADGHVSNLLAGARVSDDPDGDDVGLEQQIAASNAELRERFRAQYGAVDGEKMLDRTVRFVRKHPALAKILQQRGLGSRPEIVEGIAAHVFSTGWRG